MEAFEAFEELRATAQHIDLVQSKLDKLEAVKQDSWRQLLEVVRRLYRDDQVSVTQLLQLHRDMRNSYGGGFTRLWDATIPVPSNKLRWIAEREQRIEARRHIRSWSGSFPVDGSDELPEKGVSVVYVLFDSAGVPAYVGSTEQFKTRMKAQVKTWPNTFARWIAYPCEDREAAYELEVKLLRENLPYLNKRVGR